MTHPNKEPAQISDRFIAYLREQVNDSEIDYDLPLTQMQGGYETYSYRFKLSGVHKELSKLLVLRLYPQFYGTRNAVWESTVQNVLAREGYPVPWVYFTCTDMAILGGAFFIMEFLPGDLMVTAPMETIPDMLGKTHAALHDIDPNPLIESLGRQGIDENQYRLGSRLNRLNDEAKKFPWLCDGVDWLVENRPPEPEHLTICHSDFHPLNILIQDGQVTGVLDWPGFLVADPALDVANTIVLTTISSKHLFSSTEWGFSSVNWEQAAQLYLDSYQAQRPLDTTHLDYYRVRRCVNALAQGVDGQKVWQHPLIVKDLIEYIHRITGIRMTIPDPV